MIINGNTVYIQWGFKPETRPAVEWHRLADGNWSARDRGAAEDVFESEVVFSATDGELEDIEDYFYSHRENIDLDCTSSGEEIFGADIDHSGTLTAIVTNYGTVQRVGFSLFIRPVRLRLISPLTIGSASISALRLADYKYDAYSEFDIRRFFAFDHTAYHFDGATDPGIFKGVFRQTTAEMRAIRRYLLTLARTSEDAFPSIGVSEPFSPRIGSGPFTSKVIQWSDLGRRSFADWEIEITFARMIT